MHPVDEDKIALDILCHVIYERYGYDFRQYRSTSFKRRVLHHLAKTEHQRIAHLVPDILYNPQKFQALFFDLSVTVTEMFRDPWVFMALRNKVLSYLSTFPHINIWVAGCATGEEVYSLAILLMEEGLYSRCRIYATDINDEALNIAQSRVYPLERMRMYSKNYFDSGGKSSLVDYYQTNHQHAILTSELKTNVIFSRHNLISDGVFGEMHLILCRNVLIYFTRPLQDRVFTLFRDSLQYNGFLCLGSKETLEFSAIGDAFDAVAEQEKIYQCKTWVEDAGLV